MNVYGRVARTGLQVINNIRRRMGSSGDSEDGVVSGAAKMVIMIALSLLLSIGLVIITIWYMVTLLYQSVLCMAILNFFHGKCPTPLFEGKEINKVAEELYKKRKQANEKSDNNIQIFDENYEIDYSDTGMTTDELKEKFDSFKEKEGVFKIEDNKLIMSEARMYLLVLQQLDEEVLIYMEKTL